MHKLLIGVTFLILVHCFQYPTQLANHRIADCSHATIPNDYKSNSGKKYFVLEIYDFQQKLVNYDESTFPDSIIGVATLYWNGKDSEGKSVDEGKYLIKISTISAKDATCECHEMLYKPGLMQ